MPQTLRTCVRREPPSSTSANRYSSKVLRGLRTALVDRYRGLPPWLLLAQIFLAAGWQRAAAAHGLDPAWWSGAEITQFRVEHGESSIEWYRAIMLDGPVANWPIIVGIVVFSAQLIVAFMLALNLRPLLALAIGAGLNVNFVLAGAVNPSVFYLIIGAAIALWHVDTLAGRPSARRLTLISPVVAAILVGSLAPEIATIHPDHVIDDPAMVLSFIAVLWVLALWLSVGRSTLLALHPERSGPENTGSVTAVTPPNGAGSPPIRGRITRCGHSNRPRPTVLARI